jgi:hypothetical protein
MHTHMRTLTHTPIHALISLHDVAQQCITLHHSTLRCIHLASTTVCVHNCESRFQQDHAHIYHICLKNVKGHHAMFLYCVFISEELCNLVHEEFMIGSAGMGVWNIIAYHCICPRKRKIIPICSNLAGQTKGPWRPWSLLPKPGSGRYVSATYLTSGRKKDHVRAAAAISQEVCAQLFSPLQCPVL